MAELHSLDAHLPSSVIAQLMFLDFLPMYVSILLPVQLGLWFLFQVVLQLDVLQYLVFLSLTQMPRFLCLVIKCVITLELVLAASILRLLVSSLGLLSSPRY